jgi:HSP20 family protein
MEKAFLDPMERMVGELFGRRPTPAAAPAPSVDVIERDDEVIVRAALPGVKKEDVEISVSATVLTLRGKAPEAKKQEEGEYYRAELPHGEFERTLVLPAEVDEAKARASMKEGILELTLPKLEKRRRRRIKVD